MRRVNSPIMKGWRWQVQAFDKDSLEPEARVKWVHGRRMALKEPGRAWNPTFYTPDAAGGRISATERKENIGIVVALCGIIVT